jgi:hypothetical protein
MKRGYLLRLNIKVIVFFGVVYDALYCVVLKTNTLFCYLALTPLASLYALLDGHFDFYMKRGYIIIIYGVIVSCVQPTFSEFQWSHA